MTETNKLRAVFLAALMFLAVFAGTVALAGNAAAAHDGGPGLNPGQSQIVEEDRTINVSDEEQSQTIELYVNASNAEQNVTIDVSQSMNNGIDVVSANVSAESQLLNGTSAELDRDAQEVVVNVPENEEGVESVTLTLDTSESDLSDNRVRHVATDENGHSDNLDYRIIDVGTTVVSENGAEQSAWEGETVTLWADNAGSIVALEGAGTKGTTPGQARNFDTSGMEGGVHNATFDGANATALDIKPLNLSVSADDVHADENVTAQVTSEDLEGNEVEVALVDSNGDDVATASDNLDGDGNAEFDLGQHEEGSYDVHVRHVPSEVQASTSLDVGSAPEKVVNFDESVISQNQGDVVVINVDASGVSEFELVVGDESEMGYEATMTVTPNEDGEAVIAFNTYEAGYWQDSGVQEGDAFEGQDGTSVSGVSETNLDSALEQGLYDMIARNPADANDEYDISAFDMSERSTDGITAYTVPQGKWSETSDAASIRNGTETGTVTEASEIAANDHVVLEIEASGIYGALEGEDAKAFLEDANGVNLTLEQTNEGPNRSPKTISLSQSVVHVDEDNKTVWVALDGRDLQNVEAGDNFNATFEVGEEYEYIESADDVESVTDDFTQVERTGSLDVDGDGYVTVEPSEGQAISGSTSVAPGTDLRVRTRATGESPFLKVQEATVDADGNFAADFDFSNIEEGQEFTATVTRGDFDAEAPGRVQAADPASVSISDQEAEETGDVVTVDSVYVPDGGFVTIHDDSLLDGATFDSVRGTSDYLSEGEHQNVEVQLDDTYDVGDHEVFAMPHQDSNDNQEYDFVSSEGADDDAYRNADGEAITASATLSVVEEEETPEPTDEPNEDDGEEPEPTDTATATDSPDDQPGFGAVVALIALLGAALLAARRNAF